MVQKLHNNNKQAEMVCNDNKQPPSSITCTEVELRYSHVDMCIGKFVSQMIFSRGVPVQSKQPVPMPLFQLHITHGVV
jgi:hypothetical protein